MKTTIISTILIFSLGMTAFGAPSPYIKGTATNTAKKPYPEYVVQLRDISTNMTQRQSLTTTGEFMWSGVPTATYLVELLDPKGRVVCTEGPVDLQKSPYQNITIKCGNPAAWWLLTAAAAVGITAGVVAGGDASPSR